MKREKKKKKTIFSIYFLSQLVPITLLYFTLTYFNHFSTLK